ncbi:MAG TPA: hypothetical protein VF452_13880, partial [Candidatus Binatia bacterium]
EWVSFGFQVSNRLSHSDRHPLKSLGEFLLIQFGVTSPALLAGLFMISAAPVSVAFHRWHLKWRFSLIFSIPILAFLLLFSVHSRIKANWALPGYLSLLVAAYPCYRFLGFKSSRRKKLAVRRFLVAWFYALPVLYVVALYHFTVTLPGIPTHLFTTGWKEFGQAVDREAQAFEVTGEKKVFLLGLDSHYIAAALSFYAGDQHPVFSRNLVGKQALAFEYWSPDINLLGYNALAIDTDPPKIELLRQYFVRVDENVKRIPVMKAARVLDYVYVVKCFGYKRPDS